ncbi:hypothetical protein THAOC_19468, partial [Thalassiosira oceanica]
GCSDGARLAVRSGGLLRCRWASVGSAGLMTMSCTKLFRLVALVATTAITASLSTSPADRPLKRYRMRPGFGGDKIVITLHSFGRLINPLSDEEDSIVVAEDIKTGRRLGWAQIRSLGYASLDEDGAGENYSAGSSLRITSSASVEEDVNELIWQKFEEDPVDFPAGLRSLPWTEEYRLASKAADERLQEKEKVLDAERKSRPRLWVVSPIHVEPVAMEEGIGSALLSQVLSFHMLRRSVGDPGASVFAIVSEKNLNCYLSRGFKKQDYVPDPMKWSHAIANFKARLRGEEEPVCVRYTPTPPR